MVFLYSALGVIFAFVLVIVIRAIMFKPRKVDSLVSEPVAVDIDKAADDLAQMIRCKTISSLNKRDEDEGEFKKFKKLLPKLFPSVYAECHYEEVSDRALLLKWPGRDKASPTVLMAHYDVVSVREDGWDKPAFEGIIENGVLWGRGALDTKATLNAILQSAESLIKQGFVPERDIYFAFGGDEEINGHGAKDIVNLFVNRNIVPGLVLDEGGAVVEGVFPGVKERCALIGIAEKGMLNVSYRVVGGGGHASAPARRTPISRLANACVRIQNHPFRYRMTEPAKQMFDTVSRYSSFVYKLIFANLWCFGPVVNLIAKKSGGEFNAMVRTTVVFTQMSGSKGMNVIPSEATMVSNLRLMSGDTVESALKYLKKTAKDDKIEVTAVYGMNPSRISLTTGDAWDKICKATGATWQDAIVSPYLMLACSDSRHWSKISDKVYRFSAMALSKEERATIHGNNERIPLGTIAKTVEFYTRLMKSC